METLLSTVLPARLEHLDELMKSVSDCALSQGFDRKRVGGIELAVEEAFVNICNYSYPGKTGDAAITCRLDNNRFIIEISDSGIPFNITQLSDPDITAPTEARKIGGLGIFLMKKMMDAVTYRREGDRNVLNLIVTKE